MPQTKTSRSNRSGARRSSGTRRTGSTTVRGRRTSTAPQRLEILQRSPVDQERRASSRSRRKPKGRTSGHAPFTEVPRASRRQGACVALPGRLRAWARSPAAVRRAWAPSPRAARRAWAPSRQGPRAWRRRSGWSRWAGRRHRVGPLEQFVFANAGLRPEAAGTSIGRPRAARSARSQAAPDTPLSQCWPHAEKSKGFE